MGLGEDKAPERGSTLGGEQETPSTRMRQDKPRWPNLLLDMSKGVFGLCQVTRNANPHRAMPCEMHRSDGPISADIWCQG